jgi:Bacterial TniB protein
MAGRTGAPYSVRDQIGALEGRALDLLKKIGIKLLFTDEVHHLLAGSQREQHRVLNLQKFVANELKIVVVAVGTQDAFHALQTDAQVASRFAPLLIPRWPATDAFRAFIVAYGRLRYFGAGPHKLIDRSYAGIDQSHSAHPREATVSSALSPKRASSFESFSSAAL